MKRRALSHAARMPARGAPRAQFERIFRMAMDCYTATHAALVDFPDDVLQLLYSTPLPLLDLVCSEFVRAWCEFQDMRPSSSHYALTLRLIHLRFCGT